MGKNNKFFRGAFYFEKHIFEERVNFRKKCLRGRVQSCKEFYEKYAYL